MPDSFPTAGNLRTMIRQTTVVGIAALGMTMVVILGGIDLSVGSIVAFTTVAIAWLLQAGVGAASWAAARRRARRRRSAACSTALLITGLRVMPFIVTLGAMGIIRGAAKGLAHEQKIDAPLSWLNDLMAELPAGLALAAAARRASGCSSSWRSLVGGVLRYTRFGRHIFAIGSNEQTARLCGVNVPRVKTLVYTLSAALAGLAGLMQFSRLTVGDPTVAIGLELDVIAAVVIGGATLSGGEGSVLGSLVGAMLMTEIKTGGTHLGLSNWVQEIITGVIIIVAVALDRLRHQTGDEGLGARR